MLLSEECLFKFMKEKSGGHLDPRAFPVYVLFLREDDKLLRKNLYNVYDLW